MKKFLYALVLLVVIGLTTVNAQWASSGNAVKTETKAGLTVYFAGTMDSTGQTYGTLTSNVFTLSDYDGVTDIDYHYIITNAPGAPKVKVTLLHSDITQTAASMVAVVLLDSVKTELELSTYKALQGIRAKYYRLKLESIAGGRDASIFKLNFTLPKRDF